MTSIALITCGRSDLSIYRPLILALEADPSFDLTVIAMGTHVSPYHGNTITEIYDLGVSKVVGIESLILGDSASAISTAMGVTIEKMAMFWQQNSFDLVFCLGDRYEMFASVASTVPFNIKIAHLHGGEKTLGAIDNIFRHSLSSMSHLHFTSTQSHADRVRDIVEDEQSENIYNVGAIALDNLNDVQLFTIEEFAQKFKVDLSKPTLLLTYHPETVNQANSVKGMEEMFTALDELSMQTIITMPNADTLGGELRKSQEEFIEARDHVFGFEMLGVRGYYSAMANCAAVVGNSSSGIIEAASFGKAVVNIGDRQKGRQCGDNVFHCQATAKDIAQTITKALQAGDFPKDNIYGDGNSVDKIIEVLKSTSI